MNWNLWITNNLSITYNYLSKKLRNCSFQVLNFEKINVLNSKCLSAKLKIEANIISTDRYFFILVPKFVELHVSEGYKHLVMNICIRIIIIFKNERCVVNLFTWFTLVFRKTLFNIYIQNLSYHPKQMVKYKKIESEYWHNVQTRTNPFPSNVTLAVTFSTSLTLDVTLMYDNSFFCRSIFYNYRTQFSKVR